MIARASTTAEVLRGEGFDMHQARAYDWLFTNVVEMCDMLTRRRAVALCAVAVTFSGTLFAQNRNQKPQPNQPPKLTNAQKAELTAITQSIDAVAAGQPGQNDLSLAW